MSSSSKSSSTHTINCNVFLSFLGPDTRSRTFVSHLRGCLDHKGYTTTELGNEPSRGESDPSLVNRAITDSKVAVVVISEKFTSSTWCLESLVKILEFHQSGSLGVLIPVFYDIHPSDVRNQSGKLYEPFSSHEIENSAKVQTWRQALSQLADFSSGHYSEIWRGDAELIGKITDDIWDFLIGSKSVDFCGLVGMDRHMKALYKLLDLGMTNEVRWINIWGMPDIGKTELTKYLYEEIMPHFDRHLWLDGKFYFDSKRELHYEIRRKIRSYHMDRILLVLDDFRSVDINDLKEEVDTFGPGSRVIIASNGNINPYIYHAILRQKHEISHLGFEYEVVELEFSEALQLFCFHAFGQTHRALGFEDLSSRAVKLTGGYPVTIKKLGSKLYGRERKEWEAILSEYESLSVKGIINSNKIIHNSVMNSVSSQSSIIISNSKDLVGMDSRMKAILDLLELGSDKEVRVVGIWGRGGIGKTTLARYAYDGISHEFDTHIFLENAEDQSSAFCLEERFLSKVIEREDFAVRISKDGLDVMKSELRHHKVLLIVDNVENNKALEGVKKMASWFYNGSRIIVNTRDASLLLANGVEHAYEVKCLRFDEALQLFYQFALKQELPSDRSKQLSVYAIKLVGYIPLALKVTGSMLYGKSENDWETILQSCEEQLVLSGKWPWGSR